MEHITTIGGGMEKELSDFIDAFLFTDLKRLGLKLYDKQCGPGLGALMSFESSDLLIKVINERSIYSIVLGSTRDKKYSWDLHLIKSYFTSKNNQNQKDKNERRNILVFNWDYKQSTGFLLSQFDQIENIFNELNYPDTKRQLISLQKEREKYRWSKN